MVYLAIHVLFWMIAAFIVGLVAGWWMKKVLWISPSKAPRDTASNSNYKYEEQLADMQDRLREKQSTIHALEAELAGAKSPVKKPTKKTVKAAVKKTSAPDDLKKIYGIGKVIEGKLHKIGITKFEQVAQLSSDDIKDISGKLDAFKDRIERDNWVASAKQCYVEKYGKDI